MIWLLDSQSIRAQILEKRQAASLLGDVRIDRPRRVSRRCGEGVGEVVGVLAVGDDDVHRAGKTGQLASAGVRHDGDGQLKSAAGHGAAVLKHEGASAALERSADAFDGDVAGGTLDGGAGGQHLALAGAFEIAMELLVNGHAAEAGVAGVGVRGFFAGRRSYLYFKRSGGVSGHGGPFLGGSGILWSVLRERRGGKDEREAKSSEGSGCCARSVVHGCSVVQGMILHAMEESGEWRVTSEGAKNEERFLASLGPANPSGMQEKANDGIGAGIE